MEVKLKPWQTLTLRSDGAFVVWTVLRDGSLGEIIGPSSANDRKMVVRSYAKEVALRISHADGVVFSESYEDRRPDHEVLDKTPVEVPLVRPKTMQERIDEQIRWALERQAEKDGFESPEEAFDFDVDEDPDPVSKYELSDMQDETPINDLINDLKGPSDAERQTEESVSRVVSKSEEVERGPEAERVSSSGDGDKQLSGSQE